MSCNNCTQNGLTSCGCTDNCPYKTSDITLFDGNLNNISVPVDASLNDVLALLESYTTNTYNELSSEISMTFLTSNCLGLSPGTYGFAQILEAIINELCSLPAPVVTTISMVDSDMINFTNISPGPNYSFTASPFDHSMLAKSQPNSFNKVVGGYATSKVFSGAKQLMSEVYDDDSAYDPATGIWTCPTTGRYDLNFYVHLTSTDATNGWMGASDSRGMITAGLCSPTGIIPYTVSSFATPFHAQACAEITGSMMGLPITAGTQICLKIANTVQNYTTNSDDTVSMSIKRVK
jgi:hypothetical protein